MGVEAAQASAQGVVGWADDGDPHPTDGRGMPFGTPRPVKGVQQQLTAGQGGATFATGIVCWEFDAFLGATIS